MKIQCPCGTKYSFDVTPEMVNAPIRFVCQNCGVDSSALVNQIIRQQFGADAAPVPTRTAVAPPAAIAPPPSHRPAVSTTAPVIPTAQPAPAIRIAAPAPA